MLDVSICFSSNAQYVYVKTLPVSVESKKLKVIGGVNPKASVHKHKNKRANKSKHVRRKMLSKKEIITVPINMWSTHIHTIILITIFSWDKDMKKKLISLPRQLIQASYLLIYWSLFLFQPNQKAFDSSFLISISLSNG
jgi:hypothetical protein